MQDRRQLRKTENT